MIETGYVRAIKGNFAVIVFKRKSGCGDNCASCGAKCSSLNSEVEVFNSLNASIGDQVQLSLDNKSFFKMTLIAYGLPLLMAVIGLFVGIKLFKNLSYKYYETLAAATSLLLLAISYMIIGTLDKKISNNKNYQVKMSKILK